MIKNTRVDGKNERSEERKRSSTTVLAILASETPSRDLGLAIVDSNIIYTDLRIDLGFAIGPKYRAGKSSMYRSVCIDYYENRSKEDRNIRDHNGNN